VCLAVCVPSTPFARRRQKKGSGSGGSLPPLRSVTPEERRMPVNALAAANPPACQPGSVPSSQQRSLQSFRSFQSALKSPSCLRCQQVQRREGSALSSGKCVHLFRSFHSLITPSFSLFILSLVPIGLCGVSEPIGCLATSPASLLAIRSPCPIRVALLDNLVRALRFLHSVRSCHCSHSSVWSQ
jgi:hypothetical protein